jgi:outer membrane protein assembly factor BamB
MAPVRRSQSLSDRHIVGTDNKLHGLDGVTGASVFGGGAATDTMSAVQKFETPIVANGRIFVAANNQMYAFSM